MNWIVHPVNRLDDIENGVTVSWLSRLNGFAGLAFVSPGQQGVQHLSYQ